MKNAVKYSVFSLLLLSAIMLTSLVPGGPIETRNFSHISPLVLGSFNIFLTTLSITSFLMLYFVWRQQRWAFTGSALAGISYFLVYVLDLAHWFPVSPDAMPPALFSIEVLGTMLSIPLFVLSVNGTGTDSRWSDGHPPSNYPGNVLTIDGATVNKVQKISRFAVVVMVALLGIGIVIFATRSAMGL